MNAISRRTFMVAGGALVTATSLGKAAFAQAGSKLVWWDVGGLPDQNQAFDEIVTKRYKTTNPGADLVIDYRGNTLSDQIMVALAANSGPDIITTNGPSWTDQLVASGKLAPLNKYAEQYGWKDKIPPFMLALGTTNGELYALPKSAGTQVLFYNKSLFDANGYTAPKTLKELDDIAADCLKKRITPFAAGNSGGRFINRQYLSSVWNSFAGGDKIYQALAGKLPWNSPIFVEGVQLIKEWWDKGYFGGQNYFSITQEQSFTLMSTGRSAMSPVGTWALGWVPESFAKSNQELGWVPMPKLQPDAQYPVFPLAIGAHITINAASPNKDAAAKVLNLLTDPSVIGPLSQRWAGQWDVPLLASLPAASDKYAQMGQEIRQQTAAAMTNKTYGYTPWTFWPPKTDDYMKAGIEEVWLGQLTPKAFCDGVDSTFQGEVRSGAVKVPPNRA